MQIFGANVGKIMGIQRSNFHSDWAYTQILPYAHSNPRRGNQPPCLCPPSWSRGTIRDLRSYNCALHDQTHRYLHGGNWVRCSWRRNHTVTSAGPPGAGGEDFLKIWKLDILLMDLSNLQGICQRINTSIQIQDLPKLSSGPRVLYTISPKSYHKFWNKFWNHELNSMWPLQHLVALIHQVIKSWKHVCEIDKTYLF